MTICALQYRHLHIGLWSSATEELTRAVRAGLIKTAHPIDDNLEDCQLLTSSVAQYFFERDRLQNSRQHVTDENTDGETGDVANIETEEDVNGDLAPTSPMIGDSAYDPLPTDGIAVMFPLSRDDDKNLELWRGLAHNAPRNGLSACRVTKGSGKRQSTFDPAGVGEWLVLKGKFSQAQVDRILLNNLPARSSHLRDLLAS